MYIFVSVFLVFFSLFQFLTPLFFDNLLFHSEIQHRPCGANVSTDPGKRSLSLEHSREPLQGQTAALEVSRALKHHVRAGSISNAAVWWKSPMHGYTYGLTYGWYNNQAARGPTGSKQEVRNYTTVLAACAHCETIKVMTLLWANLREHRISQTSSLIYFSWHNWTNSDSFDWTHLSLSFFIWSHRTRPTGNIGVFYVLCSILQYVKSCTQLSKATLFNYSQDLCMLPVTQ